MTGLEKRLQGLAEQSLLKAKNETKCKQKRNKNTGLKLLRRLLNPAKHCFTKYFTTKIQILFYILAADQLN